MTYNVDPLALSLLNDFLYCPLRMIATGFAGLKAWARLRDRLLSEIKAEDDSLRFYFLDEKAVTRTEHHGVAKPIDLTEPLIL